MSTRGFIGLGSNVGDRRANLAAAAVGIDGLDGVEVLASSSVYASEPVGLVLDQPEFLNACLRVALDPELEPLALLAAVKELEREIGREPGGPRHGPRVIDIDLLWWEGREMSTETLTLPHAGVLERRFVLVGLLELEPELTTSEGERLAGVLGGLGGQGVVVDGPPLR